MLLLWLFQDCYTLTFKMRIRKATMYSEKLHILCTTRNFKKSDNRQKVFQYAGLVTQW